VEHLFRVRVLVTKKAPSPFVDSLVLQTIYLTGDAEQRLRRFT